MLTWLKYLLERWVLRGSLALVLLLVAVLGALAVAGALLGYFMPDSPFSTYQEALWWATLRLSDPGYLSDDPARLPVRILSISLSVLGMGVTVGGIVAIVTQVINSSLRRLAQATTKVPFRDHVVLLGWTDRTPRLLKDVLGERRGKVVILLEEVDQSAMRRVARVLHSARLLERVVLRSGSARRPMELDRAASRHASAILIPATSAAVAGDPQEGPRTLQTLLALRNLFEEHEDQDEPLPTVAVELVDRSLAPVVQSTMPAARALQSDRVVARVLRLCLQGPALVDFALDVAAPNRGYRVESVILPELAGSTLQEADRRIHGGRLMGKLAGAAGKKHLVIDGDTTLAAHDRLLVFGRGKVSVGAARMVSAHQSPLSEDCIAWRKSRILLLGWNETAPDLLAELAQQGPGRYEMEVLSVLDPEVRRRMSEDLLDDERVPVHHRQGNPVDPYTLGNVDLGRFDRILILADRMADPEASDVSSLSIALSIEQRRDELLPHCYVLAELLDEENVQVIKHLQAVVTPRLAADTLKTVALTPRGDETLEVTFSHQATYTTRLIAVEDSWRQHLDDLASQLRTRGLALVHVFELPGPGGQAQVLVAEAVARPGMA